jgi:hypothetical protein
MTERIGPLLVIAEEPPQQCDLCGRVDELRPYGPKGEAICFSCSEKTPAMRRAKRAAFRRLLRGEP